MAEDTNKGPVKPPIIDAKPTAKTGEAKAASASSPNKPAASKPNTKKASVKPSQNKEKPSPVPKNDKPKSGLSFSTLIIASVLGAALGTGTTSFMAFNGIAPFEKGTPTSQFNASMETLQKRVYDLENAEKIDPSSFAEKSQLDGFVRNVELEATAAKINALTAKMTSLNAALTNLGQTEKPAIVPSVDPAIVTQLQSEIDGLKASILELSPDNTQAIEAQLEQNQKLAEAIAQISILDQSQSANTTAIAALDQQFDTLSQTVNALSTELAEQPVPIEMPTSASLPLLLDAWEKALVAGAPYTDFANGAAAILPEIEQSDAHLANAQSGVTTSFALQEEFSALIPTFVKSDAGIPDDAAWYDKLAAQAKSAIGLRPLDQTGDEPLAIVARIEAALAQDNTRSANASYAQLPIEWQNASAAFAAKLAAKAAAIAQLDQARSLAIELATLEQGASQ